MCLKCYWLIMFLLNAWCSLILGDKYVNGEIIPCKYPTYQPKRSAPKNESRRYERRRDGPPPDRRRPRQETAASDSSSTWGSGMHSLFHLFYFFHDFGLPLPNVSKFWYLTWLNQVPLIHLCFKLTLNVMEVSLASPSPPFMQFM